MHNWIIRVDEIRVEGRASTSHDLSASSVIIVRHQITLDLDNCYRSGTDGNWNGCAQSRG